MATTTTEEVFVKDLTKTMVVSTTCLSAFLLGIHLVSLVAMAKLVTPLFQTSTVAGKRIATVDASTLKLAKTYTVLYWVTLPMAIATVVLSAPSSPSIGLTSAASLSLALSLVVTVGVGMMTKAVWDATPADGKYLLTLTSGQLGMLQFTAIAELASSGVALALFTIALMLMGYVTFSKEGRIAAYAQMTTRVEKMAPSA